MKTRIQFEVLDLQYIEMTLDVAFECKTTAKRWSDLENNLAIIILRILTQNVIEALRCVSKIVAPHKVPTPTRHEIC